MDPLYYSKFVSSSTAKIRALDNGVFVFQSKAGSSELSTQVILGFRGPTASGQCPMAVAFVGGMAMRRFLADHGHVRDVDDRITTFETKLVVDFSVQVVHHDWSMNDPALAHYLGGKME